MKYDDYFNVYHYELKDGTTIDAKVFLGFDAIAYETKTNCGFWQEKWTIDYTEIDSVELKCCHGRESGESDLLIWMNPYDHFTLAFDSFRQAAAVYEKIIAEIGAERK
jgi:hypothetical protein